MGETAQITAAVTPDDATLQGVTYESRKPEVATVDENGVVTGVSRGSATIRVRSEDGYAQTSVTVQVRQPAEEIQLELSKSTLPENKTASVKATVLPKDTNNKKLTWTSSDESIATVNQDGRVKGLRPGTVTITAASAEVPEVTGSIEVQVVRLAKSVAFAQKEYGVILGQTAQLSRHRQPGGYHRQVGFLPVQQSEKGFRGRKRRGDGAGCRKGHHYGHHDRRLPTSGHHSREGDRPRDRGSLRYAGTPGWAWTTTGR